MSVTPIADLLQAQAIVAHNLFVDLIRLHADVQLNGTPHVLEQVDAVTHNAEYLFKNLRLIKLSLSPPGPKKTLNQRLCPDQLPLWHDAPANLES